jgi:hypothetical protein
MSDLTGIVLGLDEQLYHSHDSLSSTGARKLLESPARFHYAQQHPQAPKAAFDLGTAAHTKILGVGAGVVAYPDEHLTKSGNVSTKAETVAWAEEQRNAGLTPISPDDVAAVDAMAESVLAHPVARALLEQEGEAEASVFATDPETGVEVRARFDYLANVCVDLKSSRKEVSPARFARTVAEFGYEVQEGFYTDALEMVTGERRDMVFIVFETAPPYLVAVHQLDRDFRDMGRVKARRARELFAECTASGVWPGYPTEISLVVPPMYAIYDFQDRYES